MTSRPLLVGAVAYTPNVVPIWEGIRDYFADSDTNCAEAGNIALTIVAGPLNYAGVNPKVDCDDVGLPEPSS